MSNPSQAGTSSNQAQQPTPDHSQQPWSSLASGSGSGTGTGRHAEEQARKDRTLAEFMLMLDEYEPMVCYWNLERSEEPMLDCFCLFFVNHLQIPNEVTDFYLQRVGFECEDVRLYVLCILPYWSLLT